MILQTQLIFCTPKGTEGSPGMGLELIPCLPEDCEELVRATRQVTAATKASAAISAPQALV